MESQCDDEPIGEGVGLPRARLSYPLTPAASFNRVSAVIGT